MSTLRHGPPLRRIAKLIDIAAHAQACAAPPIVWRQLEGPGRCPAPAPAFLFGGAGAGMARQIFGRIDLPLAGCFAAADAAICPGGVIITGDAGCFGEALGTPMAHAAAVLDGLYAHAATTGIAPDTAASLFGASNDAASLLTDVMPRLWVLAATGHDISRIFLPVPADAHPEAAALLRAAGLTGRQLLPGDVTGPVLRAPRVLAPARLRRGARFSPLMGEATRFWTSRVRESLGLPPPQPARGLFLSPRDTAEPSGVAHWQDIEAAAVAQGLSVIHPAGLSLAERIATFGQADCLLGFDGAALTEACIFAPSGIPVCAIRGSTASGVRLAGLAPALGQAIGFVFGVYDPEDPGLPATVDVSALQLALKALMLAKIRPNPPDNPDPNS